MAVGADGLLAICEGQDLLTQTAVLGEGLLVHLLGDVANQHLRRQGGGRFRGERRAARHKCREQLGSSVARADSIPIAGLGSARTRPSAAPTG